ncbi:Packaging protein [Senna tora]|uniref:Packaging protein n=1 Tax=Senna tora TaxID=362788 RepID=A0A834TXW9_9FABA|nr:Packaging protein [Senna tora]
MALKQIPDRSGISLDDAWSSECGPTDSGPQEELEKLDSDVKQRAHTILQLRSSLPDQLKTTLASVLVAHTPLLTHTTGHSKIPSSDASEQEDLIGEKQLKLEDPETAKKVQLLKEKISSNASAMPVVLKRMKDCIARIEKLDSYNVAIHPAFKRKRTK